MGPLILTIFGIQDDGKISFIYGRFAIMVISARTGHQDAIIKNQSSHSWRSNRQILRNDFTKCLA